MGSVLVSCEIYPLSGDGDAMDLLTGAYLRWYKRYRH